MVVILKKPSDSFRAKGPTNLIVNICCTTSLFELMEVVRRHVSHPVNLVRVVLRGDSGRLLFSNGTAGGAISVRDDGGAAGSPRSLTVAVKALR
jgi:hypothetical protein